MITYGFFNSENDDRLYNADTFNSYFEGLISQNGVFENVDDGFAVSPGDTGLTVNVAAGKALVNAHWIRNTAVQNVSISAAHNLFGRYDMISLIYEETLRTVRLALTTGTASSDPVKPQPKKTGSEYEIVLAYVYVPANASSITLANIIDTRHDTALCGIIAGLVQQVDITELYEQYTARFDALEAQMKAWETEQKNQFNTWFSALTDQLNVNTYIEAEKAKVETTGTNSYIDFPSAITYVAGDTLLIFVNGLYKTNYAIEENEVEHIPMLHFTEPLPNNAVVDFCNLKSKIGMTAS